MKVSELQGIDLDRWVAKAEGIDVAIERVCCGRGEQSSYDQPPECCGQPNEVLAINDGMFPCNEWAPSRNWTQAGALIEKHGMGIVKFYEPADGPIPLGSEWAALSLDDQVSFSGPTPLIAAMRLVVALQIGREAPGENILQTGVVNPENVWQYSG